MSITMDLTTPSPGASNDTDPGMSSEGFPMSIIVTGFFVTSLAYLVCFCCCIIQFFIRRGRELSVSNANRNTTPGHHGNSQKNDTLKQRFLKQFRYSLKKFKKSRPSISMVTTAPVSYGSCPICFDEYLGEPAEIFMGYIKGCEHYFHFDCIWTWLETRGNCPLCREKVALKECDVIGLSLRHIVDKKGVDSKNHKVTLQLGEAGERETNFSAPTPATADGTDNSAVPSTSDTGSDDSQESHQVSVAIVQPNARSSSSTTNSNCDTDSVTIDLPIDPTPPAVLPLSEETVIVEAEPEALECSQTGPEDGDTSHPKPTLLEMVSGNQHDEPSETPGGDATPSTSYSPPSGENTTNCQINLGYEED